MASRSRTSDPWLTEGPGSCAGTPHGLLLCFLRVFLADSVHLPSIGSGALEANETSRKRFLPTWQNGNVRCNLTLRTQDGMVSPEEPRYGPW